MAEEIIGGQVSDIEKAAAADTGKQPKQPKKKSNQKRKSSPKEREADRRKEQIEELQATRRRRRQGIYTLYYVLLAFILTSVCIILSLTVFFNVKKIVPTGSMLYTKEEVLAAADADIGDNLLRLNTEKISKRAMKVLTKAESIEVRRHFPDQLDIVVTDGDPVLQIEQAGTYFQFTQKGRLVSITTDPAVDAQVIVGPIVGSLKEGQYMSELDEEQDETLANWRILSTALWNYSINDISAMDLSDELRLRLYYQNRIEVDLGTLTDIDIKIATLKAILYDSESIGVDEVGTLDLTDPDRAYFNNRADCVVPTGAMKEGWNWEDPYSESLQKELYAKPIVVPGAIGGPASIDLGVDGTVVDIETGESYNTADGMRLPQLPVIGVPGEESSEPTVTLPEDIGTNPNPPIIPSSVPEPEPEPEPSSEPEPEPTYEGAAPVQLPDAAGSGMTGTTGGVGGGIGSQAPVVPGIGN